MGIKSSFSLHRDQDLRAFLLWVEGGLEAEWAGPGAGLGSLDRTPLQPPSRLGKVCSPQHSCAPASPDLPHVSQGILPPQLLGAQGRRGRLGSPGSGRTVGLAPAAVFCDPAMRRSWGRCLRRTRQLCRGPATPSLSWEVCVWRGVGVWECRGWGPCAVGVGWGGARFRRVYRQGHCQGAARSQIRGCLCVCVSH